MCVLCGFLIVKYMSKGPYYGNPPPENGRVALTFDSGVAIDLVNSDDASWWEVCTNIYINWTQGQSYNSSKYLSYNYYENNEIVCYDQGRLNGNQGFFPASLVEPTRLVSRLKEPLCVDLNVCTYTSQSVE
jgi:hypothetical protein